MVPNSQNRTTTARQRSAAYRQRARDRQVQQQKNNSIANAVGGYAGQAMRNPDKPVVDSGWTGSAAAGGSGTTTPTKPKATTVTAPTPSGNVAPPPVRSSFRIDVTPNKQVGKPAGVAAAEADKVAALAALAAQQRQQEVAARDLYSQGLMAAQSSAADIYGGRAPAIFGQAVTGAKRGYVSDRSQQVQQSIAERTALRRAYDEAIRQAYVNAAQQRQQAAYDRAQLAMMARQSMGY